MSSIYFDKPTVIRSHLDFSISDAVPAGDTRTGLYFYATILDDHAILYSWLDQNLEAFLGKIPSVYHQSLPQLFQTSCNSHNQGLMNGFFEGRGYLYASALAKANETMESCIGRRARESDALDRFLAQYSD